MSQFTTIAGIDDLTGKINKRSDAVTRRKIYRDPLTGKVLCKGPKEYYRQEARDYKRHPRTDAEQRQLERWTRAWQTATRIVHDRAHPRYDELYVRWRAQLRSKNRIIQFGNFVRSVLTKED